LTAAGGRIGAAAALAAIAILAAAAWAGRAEIAAAVDGARGSGVKGMTAALGVYVALALAAFPVSWFTAVAGYVFGPGEATALACAGTTLGASLAFVVGRHLFRPRVAAWIAKKPRMDRLSREVGGDAFKLIVLARLSPLTPFGVLTYGLSVMPVRFAPFFFGTLAGKLPGNVFYALLGAGAKSLQDAASGDAPAGEWRWVLLTCGAAATGALVWFLTRALARK
jgi:uncharacterized membrane protein YdjX (TVP38/TMEM64 family)